MKNITYFFRFIYIQYIFAKHGIDRVIFSTHWFSPVRFLIYFNPWNWFRAKDDNPGQAIRLAFEELGPIFIKFGQVLSTRRDLLPIEIANELSRLQDNVPPFPAEQARAIIEKSLGKSIETLFASFDDIPLAAASIAQVHTATLHNGKSVVIKILRPDIHKKIQQDIDLLYILARLAECNAHIRRLKPKAIIREFEIDLQDELDLQREAGNASQFRRNFDGSPLLYIPSIEWEYTNSHIMVMERIEGIPIASREMLLAHGINFPQLAANGVKIFFTQVFRDAFFHADMHPGNIFVSKEHPQEPQYILVDFGIVGTLTDKDKRYIAENLYAFFNRDYRRVAELHMESGWLHADTRVERFESAIRAVSEPIFEKPLKDISFAQVVFNLIQTARKFHLNIQPQLVLLQKTLLSIEGLARQLDPNLDLWTTAKPFLEDWIKEQIGLKAFLHNTQKNLPFLAEHLPELPRLLHEFLTINSKRPHSVNHSSERPKKRSWLLGSTSFITGALLGGWAFYQFF